jgi:hypothetical protein
VPASTAIQRWPAALASSIAKRVSLVNLQKFTLSACDERASMPMFAPAQNTSGIALSTSTHATSGCSKRRRCATSRSSTSTPRS